MSTTKVPYTADKSLESFRCFTRLSGGGATQKKGGGDIHTLFKPFLASLNLSYIFYLGIKLLRSVRCSVD